MASALFCRPVQWVGRHERPSQDISRNKHCCLGSCEELIPSQNVHIYLHFVMMASSGNARVLPAALVQSVCLQLTTFGNKPANALVSFGCLPLPRGPWNQAAVFGRRPVSGSFESITAHTIYLAACIARGSILFPKCTRQAALTRSLRSQPPSAMPGQRRPGIGWCSRPRAIPSV